VISEDEIGDLALGSFLVDFTLLAVRPAAAGRHQEERCGAYMGRKYVGAGCAWPLQQEGCSMSTIIGKLLCDLRIASSIPVGQRRARRLRNELGGHVVRSPFQRHATKTSVHPYGEVLSTVTDFSEGDHVLTIAT